MLNALFSRSSRRTRDEFHRFIENEYSNEVRSLTRCGVSHDQAVAGIARRLNYVR